MKLKSVEHRPGQYIRACCRIADRDDGDIGVGECKRQRSEGRHARQHTAEAAAAAGLMTVRAIFAIRRRMEAEPKSSCQTCGSWWRLPVLLALVLAAIFLSRDRLIRELPRKGADKTADQTGSSI